MGRMQYARTEADFIYYAAVLRVLNIIVFCLGAFGQVQLAVLAAELYGLPAVLKLSRKLKLQASGLNRL